MNPDNPSTKFGGTWKQITDRFLYCANNSKQEGGSKKITTNNFPAHSHSVIINTTSAGNHSHSYSGNTSSAGNHNHTFAGTKIASEAVARRCVCVGWFGYDTSAGYITESDTYKDYTGCFRGSHREKKPKWDEGVNAYNVKFSTNPIRNN